MVYPYHFSPRYGINLTKRGNYGIIFNNWMVRLYKDCIRVQLRANKSFNHVDKLKAINMAETEFNAVLRVIANKLGFSYEKEGRISIDMVDSHIALNGSEIARASKGEYIKVKDIDGKVCFLIDQSKGAEHEFIGKQSFEHSERFEPYYQDLIYNQPMTNSQIQSRLSDMVILFEKLIWGLNQDK